MEDRMAKYYKDVADNYRSEIKNVISEFSGKPQDFDFSDFVSFFTKCMEKNEEFRSSIEGDLNEW